ncbi:hypothetical protein ACWEC4_21780 [Streptomyces sp. NPDC005055]
MSSVEEYKSVRAEADHLAALLRAALVRAGVPESETAKVRALVTAKGRAYVQVGVLRLPDANRLLEVLPLSQLTSDGSRSSMLPAEAIR